MAKKKQAQVQERKFGVPLTARETPEVGYHYTCGCGHQWWASDASWTGCRHCHTFEDEGLKIDEMRHDAAVAAALYCVTTGGLGYAETDDGIVWAASAREYNNLNLLPW